MWGCGQWLRAKVQSQVYLQPVDHTRKILTFETLLNTERTKDLNTEPTA